MVMSITNNFNEIVLERQSIRSYDPNFKIPEEELKKIIKEATSAPSAFNLQPWRFKIIHS